MTITAKYDGKCSKCGGRIKKGDSIEWTKGAKPHHTECPDQPEPVEEKPGYGKSWPANGRQAGTSCGACGRAIRSGQQVRYRYPGKVLEHLRCPSGSEQSEKVDAPYKIGGGSGYDCRGWVVGQVVRTSDRNRAKGWPEYITVVDSSESYFAEDGMSFGVGDESGYVYSASCRAATDEEIAPIIERAKKREGEQAAKKAAAEKAAEEYKTAFEKATTGLTRITVRPDGIEGIELVAKGSHGLYDCSISIATVSGKWIAIESVNSYDDWRTYYWLPADMARETLLAYAAENEIGVEQAREWLAKFEGCCGEELYRAVVEAADEQA